MSTRTRLLPLIGITVLALAAPRPAHAQFKFGPQLDWASQSIGFGVGARAEMSLDQYIPTVKGLGVNASFDYFFPGSSITFWEINADPTYHFAIPNVSFAPYVGAGLNLSHTSVSNCPFSGCSSTNAGLNLLVGTNFPALGKITPFAELRVEIRTGGAFVITGGVLF